MSPNFKFAVLGDSRGTKAQSIQINVSVKDFTYRNTNIIMLK